MTLPSTTKRGFIGVCGVRCSVFLCGIPVNKIPHCGKWLCDVFVVRTITEVITLHVLRNITSHADIFHVNHETKNISRCPCVVNFSCCDVVFLRCCGIQSPQCSPLQNMLSWEISAFLVERLQRYGTFKFKTFVWEIITWPQ